MSGANVQIVLNQGLSEEMKRLFWSVLGKESHEITETDIGDYETLRQQTDPNIRTLYESALNTVLDETGYVSFGTRGLGPVVSADLEAALDQAESSDSDIFAWFDEFYAHHPSVRDTLQGRFAFVLPTQVPGEPVPHGLGIFHMRENAGVRELHFFLANDKEELGAQLELNSDALTGLADFLRRSGRLTQGELGVVSRMAKNRGHYVFREDQEAKGFFKTNKETYFIMFRDDELVVSRNRDREKLFFGAMNAPPRFTPEVEYHVGYHGYEDVFAWYDSVPGEQPDAYVGEDGIKYVFFKEKGEPKQVSVIFCKEDEYGRMQLYQAYTAPSNKAGKVRHNQKEKEKLQLFLDYIDGIRLDENQKEQLSKQLSSVETLSVFDAATQMIFHRRVGRNPYFEEIFFTGDSFVVHRTKQLGVRGFLSLARLPSQQRLEETEPSHNPLIFLRQVSQNDPNVINLDNDKLFTMFSKGENEAALVLMFEKTGRKGSSAVRLSLIAKQDGRTSHGSETKGYIEDIMRYIQSGKTKPLAAETVTFLKREVQRIKRDTTQSHDITNIGVKEGSTVSRDTLILSSYDNYTYRIESVSDGLVAWHQPFFELNLQAEAAQSEMITTARQDLITRRFRALPRQADPKSGLSHVRQYEDGQGLGIAFFYKVDGEGQETDEVERAVVYHTEGSLVSGLRQLEENAVLNINQDAAFSQWAQFQDALTLRRPTGRGGDILMRSDGMQPPSVVSVAFESAFFRHLREPKKGIHALLQMRIDPDQYAQGETDFSSYLFDHDVDGSHHVLRLGDEPFMFQDGPVLPQLDISFETDEQGWPVPGSVHVIQDDEHDVSYTAEITPYESEGRRVPCHYVISWMIGDLRVIAGINLGSIEEPRFSRGVLVQRVTNPEEVHASYEPVRVRRAINSALSRINNFRPPVTQVPVTASLSSRTPARDFIELATEPLPIAINFNKETFRAFRTMKDKMLARMVFQYVSLRIGVGTDPVQFRLVQIDTHADGDKVFVLEDFRAEGSLGVLRFVWNQSEGGRLEFDEGSPLYTAINQRAYGPRLTASFNEEDRRVSVATLFDDEGIWDRSLTRVLGEEHGFSLEEDLSNEEEILERLEQLRAMYASSLDRYHAAMLDSSVSVEGVSETVSTLTPSSEVLLSVAVSQTVLGDVVGVEVCDLTVRGEPVADVTVDGQELTGFPIGVISYPIQFSVVRELGENQGWEVFDIELTSAEEARVTNHRSVTVEDATSIATIHPSIPISEEQALDDPFTVQISRVVHPRGHVLQNQTTLVLEEPVKGLAGVDAVVGDLFLDDSQILFDVPNFGSLIYDLEASGSGQITSMTRESVPVTWHFRNPNYCIVGEIEGREPISIPLVKRVQAGQTYFFVDSAHVDSFLGWMRVIGQSVDYEASPNEHLQVAVLGDQSLSVQSRMIVNDLIVQTSLDVSDSALASLRQAMNPPALVGAPAGETQPIQTVPVTIRDLTILDFEPGEALVTGEQTLSQFKGIFIQGHNIDLNENDLAQAIGGYYELEATESGIVIMIPVTWRPDRASNPFQIDNTRRAKAYIKGDDPSSAVEITDSRFRMEDRGGRWSLSLTEAGLSGDALKLFQVLVMPSSASTLIQGGLNVLDVDHKRLGAEELTERRQQTVDQIDQNAVQYLGNSMGEMPQLVYAEPHVSQDRNRNTTLTFFSADSNQSDFIELSGIQYRPSEQNLRVVGEGIQAKFGRGHGDSRRYTESINLIPIETQLHRDGTHCLIEVRDDGSTGRVFTLNLRHGRLVQRADLSTVDPADLASVIEEIGLPTSTGYSLQGTSRGRFVTRGTMPRDFSNVEVDEVIPTTSQTQIGYFYPESSSVRDATVADSDIIQDAMLGIHDGILVLEEEAAFAAVLNGRKTEVLRFVSRNVMIELEARINDQGEYVFHEHTDPDVGIPGSFLIRDPNAIDKAVRVPVKFGYTRQGSTSKLSMTVAVANFQESMDLEVHHSNKTLNRESLSLKGRFHDQQSFTSTADVRYAHEAHLRTLNLYEDATYTKSDKGDFVTLPDGREMEVMTGEGEGENSFDVAGIDHQEDDSGVVERSFAIVNDGSISTQIDITRSRSGTATYRLSDVDGTEYIMVISDHGEPCVFRRSDHIARIINAPPTLRFKMLNQELKGYLGDPHSASKLRRISDSYYEMDVCLGRWTGSGDVDLETQTDKPWVSFGLHINRITGRVSIDPKVTIKNPKPTRTGDHLEADVHVVKLPQGKTRIYFKSARGQGYGMLDVSGLDSLASLSHVAAMPKIKIHFGQYQFNRFAQNQMPTDAGFLAILYGMVALDSVMVELFLSTLTEEPDDSLGTDAAGQTIKQRLIASDQSFADFPLFVSALQAYGVAEEDEDFEPGFRSLIEAIRIFKQPPVPPTQEPDRTPPTPVTPVPTSTPVSARRFYGMKTRAQPIGPIALKRPLPAGRQGCDPATQRPEELLDSSEPDFMQDFEQDLTDPALSLIASPMMMMNPVMGLC